VIPAGPRFGQDPAAASWLAPRLTGQQGHVTGVVPDGFDAYARILHPVEVEAGRTVPWAAIARAAGSRVHPLAQWHRVATTPSGARGWWREAAPEEGNLHPSSLTELLGLLRRHTTTPDDCWFCLWSGYGWVRGGPAVGLMRFGGEEPREERPAPPAVPLELRTAGRLLRLPGREYLLGRGPLDAASGLGHGVTPDWFLPQSPNLFWPHDRAWCVGTEIDLDSTLVGGTERLVAALVDHPRLEAWRVHPRDSLREDADHVNGPDARA